MNFEIEKERMTFNFVKSLNKRDNLTFIQKLISYCFNVNILLMKTLKAILILCFFSYIKIYAQLSNDNCTNPIVIPDPSNYCSKAGEYTNIGATPSGYGAASCFSNAGNDVWFSFVARASDINITIKGNLKVVGEGGTMARPEAALYFGTCGGTINELECDSDASNKGFISFYQGGLIIGATYYIRVQGRSNGVGTFQICTINYNPPKEPSGDCPTASILCDKSPFVVQAVTGAGLDSKEADGAQCFSNGSTGVSNIEMNSTWFAWTCEQTGTLTFKLTPLKITDDLDFIVYELPNGVKNCSGKVILRCMAAGSLPFEYPTPCSGPTGLSLTATDLSETAGCDKDLPKDNFVKALDMVAGKSYAVMINNFTSTGTGFAMEFGGTGTFVGPKANMKITSPSTKACATDTLIFEDASTFALGSIVDWSWSFGVGAIPLSAKGKGPHKVAFNNPGIKSIALTVTTERGCLTTIVQNYLVEGCCDTKNKINTTSAITNLKCFEIPIGAISVSVITNPLLTTSYTWNTGSTTNSLNSLAAGDFSVTVSNNICDTVLTYKVTQPSEIVIDTIITKPTCNGGIDGAIQLSVKGGTTPYKYVWFNGNTTDKVSNLPVGNYAVTLTDNNGCTRFLNIPLRELELILDPVVQAITSPSCNGFKNGKIVVSIANGRPPYQYDFNDGKGFVSANILDNIGAGNYIVDVLDANGCRGKFNFAVAEPTPLVLDLDTTNVSCFGLKDGSLEAFISGGVGNYVLKWSNGITGLSNPDLPAGAYTVTATDGNGCIIRATGTITQPPQLFLAVTDVKNVICFGGNNGSISILGSGGTPGYKYSLNNGTYQTDTTFKNLLAGNYTLTVQDSLGCRTTVTARIFEPEQLVADAGRDTTVELGYAVWLKATYTPKNRIVTFDWSPKDLIENCLGTCQRVEVAPLKSTYFIVTVTDQSGCIATDKVLVNVTKTRPVYIPNAISPNHDGNNDKFTVYSNISAKNIKIMKIFNRWGSLVFEAKDFPPNEERFGWDGYFNGRELPPDVFAYYIELEFIDGEVVPYKGDITIIK